MILRPEEAADAARAGGKGAALQRLAAAGIDVPPFFVLSTEAFERHVRDAGIDPALPDAAARIEAATMPAAIAAAITAAFGALGASRVAVRSSAASEDSAGSSFAGQLETFLYVESVDAVLASVKRCWASAFSDHAIAYTKGRGLSPADARVAVVVQSMVEAEAAGVAFSLDPVSGARDRVVVTSVWGLGEGLVSGRFDADTFHVHRESGAILERAIVEKPLRLVRGASGGVHEESVPAADAARPSVSDEHLARIARQTSALERLFGRPQDVEWAIAKDRLHVLQSRPITTAFSGPGAEPRPARSALPGASPIQIWDNANIVESYSGVTSPLTFTFARNAYHLVYVQFCEVMGVPRAEIERRDRMLRNMLGYLDGRVYYNLLNWYGLIGLFPGFKSNKQFMEGMMGVRESLPADAQALLVMPGSVTLADRVASVKLAAKMLVRFFRLRSTVTRFRAHFDASYERYRRLDLRGKPWEELLALYREMDDVFLRNWKAPLINDFFAMVAFGMLRKWTTGWGVDPKGGLQNDLLCGEGGVESALPTEALMEIAVAIRARPEWAEAFRTRQVAELRSLVEAGGTWSELKSGIADYVDRFGFRCMNELKLEESDLHRDPSVIYQTLKNYLGGDPPSVEAMRARERKIRSDAEAVARKQLGAMRRILYFRVLKNARETVKNRENLRFARTKVFGLARRIFDAAGEDLALRGRLADARDVYFLTLEELEGLVDASLLTQDLAALVAIRKREHARFLAAEPDERFVTRGSPYIGNTFARPKAPPSADGVLRGIGCCPGTLTARAKVITGPKDDLSLDGGILVARRTDPGWTPLFPSARGILVERGSLLSHSAIVARELGIPCVVGIPGLIDRVKTGDLIEMDGAAGWARIIEPAP